MLESVELLSLEVPCNRDAPGKVRRALARDDRLGRLRDDGILVASELVANAVLHSGCETDHTLQVRARLHDESLLISVHDPGLSGHGAVRRHDHDARPGGWGLQIVEQLARCWGAERPDGYRVWAELTVPGMNAPA
jgi:anti-sigma regulatory factor (Ser/Thr protein kinase)